MTATETETFNHEDSIETLKRFLQEICDSNAEDAFIRRLSSAGQRWSTVKDLVSVEQKRQFVEIAFRSHFGGFSAGNLKAHYVLDEDFIDGGSALVLFSLVGSTWNYVVRIQEQNSFIPVSAWLEERIL